MAYFTGKGYTYYEGSEQRHSRAPFLILAADSKNNIYACIRQVALSQLGHFMMGRARIGGQTIIISGSYGSDGLPLEYDSMSESVSKHFRRIPDEIAVTFWAGGGHNSAGAEYPTMAEYAKGLMNIK